MSPKRGQFRHEHFIWHLGNITINYRFPTISHYVSRMKPGLLMDKIWIENGKVEGLSCVHHSWHYLVEYEGVCTASYFHHHNRFINSWCQLWWLVRWATCFLIQLDIHHYFTQPSWRQDSQGEEPHVFWYNLTCDITACNPVNDRTLRDSRTGLNDSSYIHHTCTKSASWWGEEPQSLEVTITFIFKVITLILIPGQGVYVRLW